MSIWISRNGQNFGPYTAAQLEAWLTEGKVSQLDQAWKDGQHWRPLGDLLREDGCVIPPPPPQPAGIFHVASGSGPMAEDTTIRRIADYERVSGILWIVLGVLQCISLVGIVAGIWNIVAGISRVRSTSAILARDPGVPAMFEGIAGLIVIGIVNLLLGGAIGVIFIVFDFVIRDMVLNNRHLFERKGTPPLVANTIQSPRTP